MTSKAAQARQEKAEAIARLQDTLKPGDRVYTILKHVSQSGMSRVISVVHVTTEGEIECLDWLIARAGIFNRTTASARQDGLKVSGCGMDMGFHVVYEVSGAVFSDGYALKQSWL